MNSEDCQRVAPNTMGTSYNELADLLTSLPLLLREARRQRRLSQRAAAEQLGCSFSTVSRIEAGEDCALSNAVAVLKWIAGQPAEAQPPASAYAVVYDWGGFGCTGFDFDQAVEFARNAGSAVVALPIVADYRTESTR